MLYIVPLPVTGLTRPTIREFVKMYCACSTSFNVQYKDRVFNTLSSNSIFILDHFLLLLF